MEIKSKKFGILGSGQMGEVILSGLRDLGIPGQNIICTDIREERLKELEDKYQVKTSLANSDGINGVDVVILAVKPQMMDDVLVANSKLFTGDQTVITVAAGLKIDYYQAKIKENPAIVRVMPNTPSLVKVGASAVTIEANGHDKGQKKELVETIFNRIGNVYFIKEDLMDAVTGLSGSGPAYIFLMIQALSDGGVREGLPREMATDLAIQTILGSAKLAAESDLHPAQLKEAVASPGGTTIAALRLLEKEGVRGSLMDAVHESSQRSRELGE